ncbi:TIGR03667 family PPOX class F420-dependent oxidoreductase [Phytoactinopolyspora halotolerans]|uniref:TIGR03667 family PPOX class F420-dependent oxidoreductase n=1 Tax=Phytoactinopolyspora halotolerans TaxID=1981512 RepID=A0A6L9SBY6_9ACTN|nr:TIGR03667 family PPOX class F420-dependent oxidoreductase [Phytoactinopolyspora halotolerans]NEE02593.1 TIGR03667 family PPOX class F420-dependent oxidoreductase [Phytoactinopolyspora halotolerans]
MNTGVLATDEIRRRLEEAKIIWLTTVARSGQPQSSPVGFIWDGARFLIISQPEAAKVANLAENPKAALHLDIDENAADGGVITVEGTAELDPAPLTQREASTYVERYADEIRASGFTPETALEEFSQVIRVTPTRVRKY